LTSHALQTEFRERWRVAAHLKLSFVVAGGAPWTWNWVSRLLEQCR